MEQDNDPGVVPSVEPTRQEQKTELPTEPPKTEEWREVKYHGRKKMVRVKTGPR